MVTFYNEMVRSQITRTIGYQPMTKLLKTGSVFNWSTEQENALCELKHRLIDSPVLAFPRFDIPFYLAVDTVRFHAS
jgi:hypothetical protein